MGASHSRRGQITLVAIVGIMLVLVFVFLFSLKKPFDNGADKEPSVNRVLAELESGLAKEHITSCIFKVSSDGLERVGANGGIIYSFEGGAVPLFSLVEGKDYVNFTKGLKQWFVQYGLRENDYCPILDYSIPAYPVAGVSFAEYQSLYSADKDCFFGKIGSGYDGVFGKSTLPKLCSLSDDVTCQPFGRGEVTGLTIQKQLEDYLYSRLPLCVNLSDFEETYDAKIEMNGVIVPKVYVRDTEVQVSVDYPLKVTFRDAQPLSKVFSYQVVQKVRLGGFYNYIYDVLSQDASKILYDARLQSLASVFYKDGFKMRKLDNVCSTCELPLSQDDIFEFVDDKSILKGLPFVFRVAIQERRPALEFISNVTHQMSQTGVHTDTEVLIPISAIDPDDTNISYVFLSEGVGGWQEDVPGIIVDINGQTFLKFIISADSDLGSRDVKVLAYDEVGLFDYQDFNINIVDSGFVFPEDQLCIDDCVAYGAIDAAQCVDWCWLSANPCNSYCNFAYDSTGSQCTQCVEKIIHSKDLEEFPSHPDCFTLFNKDDCVAAMPDCFWILEKDFSGIFTGKCYSDRDLHLVSSPAYLID